jgi:anti-anti-sigma factor
MAHVPLTEFGDDLHRSEDATAGVFIHDDTHPRAAIVHVFGEATFADTAALESMIVSVVRIGRPVVIDMRECTYMDCTTIGVFVRAAKNLGDQLRLVIPRKSQGYRMLDLTDLTRVLHIFDRLDDAIAPIAEGAPQKRLRLV